MATHYTCDRCGLDCEGFSDKFGTHVEIEDWKGDGTVPPRTAELGVSVHVQAPFGLEDRPDLCAYCQVDILLAMCTVILDNRPVDGTTEAEPTL